MGGICGLARVDGGKCGGAVGVGKGASKKERSKRI